MAIENKLDDDFLFYLEFANSFLNNVKDENHSTLCRAWLYKLCGEQYTDIESKRNRNVYLSNLVLCMQEGKLNDKFLRSPNDVNISNAMQEFGTFPPAVTEPDWLQEILEASDDESDFGDRDGRTYLATRTLPGGEGAFAYLAVTLADDEPKWLGGGEGAFDAAMEEKFQEHVPPVSEMERILLRRKDPAERERVLAFYDTLIQNINKELEGDIKAEDNGAVTRLLNQLVEDLKNKDEYQEYENMPEDKQRVELLLILHDRTYARRKKIAKREEMLDDVENQTLPHSFFETSVLEKDRMKLPVAMWEQAINKHPNKKNMEKLFENYPHILIQKFLDLLANEKETIALRLQNRHENIAAQMRKDLREEGVKGQAKITDIEKAFEKIKGIFNPVKAAHDKKMEADNKAKDKKKQVVKTDQTEIYEQMRMALFDTQKNVEEEAERGRLLAEQINSVNAQTELYQHATEENIRKTEETNIAYMKNIKRLRTAVKQYENRIGQIQEMASRSRQDAFFI